MSTFTLPAQASATNGVPLLQGRVPGRELYRFVPEQYDRMVLGGILGEKDRVELLEGLVVNKMARNPRHDGTLDLGSPGKRDDPACLVRA
jgi:hypothetical protein